MSERMTRDQALKRLGEGPMVYGHDCRQTQKSSPRAGA